MYLPHCSRELPNHKVYAMTCICLTAPESCQITRYMLWHVSASLHQRVLPTSVPHLVSAHLISLNKSFQIYKQGQGKLMAGLVWFWTITLFLFCRLLICWKIPISQFPFNNLSKSFEIYLKRMFWPQYTSQIKIWLPFRTRKECSHKFHCRYVEI
jgi:hypothetical protein